MPPGGPPAPNAAFRFAAAGFRSGLNSAPAGEGNLTLPKMAVLKAVAKFKALPREKNRYFDGVFRGQGIAHNLKMHLENHHKVNWNTDVRLVTVANVVFIEITCYLFRADA